MKIQKNNFKILIVDDIEENLRVIGNILGEENISISLAKSGKHALKILTRKMPDLILLDISMPEMDGYEVCSIIKNDENTKHIPVIFLTARTQTEDIVKAFNLGAVDYVTKPFNKHELLSRVFTHLDLKKSRDLITEQKKELQIKNDALETHKTKIEEQHRSIVSSIQYAKIIQDAILPSKGFLKQLFPDSFTLYIPKDIVSGDFYWSTQINNKIAIVAADCTGHGVPGAFMSMLGIAFLNEIFNKFDTTSEISANLVLNTLRKKVKVTLRQDESTNSTSDGIDMALCIIDLDTKKMDYAGANNPLYLVRFNEEKNKNILQVYEPDKMPIAVHLKETTFTNHEIQLKTNDIIYLFSDGYSDQFGGENNKRFQRSNFKNMLLGNCSKQMEYQSEIFSKLFFDWKGNNEQVDDVLIIGIRVPEIFGKDN